MEADFSGYATKAGLKCSDGRTIMPDAFKHQDSLQVPLVWQHGHTDPLNVLGHVLLENRADGVYAYGFLNNSDRAKHTAGLLEHKDITMMSIWANELVQKAGRVLHGAIREVSLVLSGANPGALIENVTIRHSDDDGTETVLEDEAIIYTGLELEHATAVADKSTTKTSDKDDKDDNDGSPTVKEVYESFTDEQKTVVHYMIGEAIEAASDDKNLKQDNVNDTTDTKSGDTTDTKSGDTTDTTLKQDNLNNDNKNDDTKGNSMKHNVFEKEDGTGKTAAPILSHSDIEGIVGDAMRSGSLKTAVQDYALQHGIDNIDVLFPEAQTVGTTPEWLTRRVEWVNTLLGAVRKSPFARIKTMSADLTLEEARAKGYVKGNFKKEEFFSVTKRVTTPFTVYKKQKLDRDDIVDITDFDVVVWLKGEMRLMLDEELARAVLIGDGRDFAHDDKINETNIRPIAKDHELYTTTVNVNIDDTDSTVGEVIDAIVSHRHHYRGTGLPLMFTTETYISKFLLLKDTVGRRLYKNLDEIAAELRVAQVVPVEVLDDEPTIVAILVNPVDYVIGADRGGNISMFDDFDIDYNAHKYLIETRVSGALTKLKSAIVVRRVAAALVQVTPNEPAFDGTAISITDQPGVVYTNAADGTIMNAVGSPYPLAVNETRVVDADPAAGYYFPSSEGDSWTFTRRA